MEIFPGTAPVIIPQCNLELRVSIVKNIFVVFATDTSTLTPSFGLSVACKYRVNPYLVPVLIFLANRFY